MKSWIFCCLIIGSGTLVGCGTVPTEPVVPGGKAKVAVNEQAAIAKTMFDYYRSLADKDERLVKPRSVEKLSIDQVLEKFVPADFVVYAGDGVDLNTLIEFDNKRSWIESLGQPLSDSGIEMTADLVKKTILLRVASMSIGQALDRVVPRDFTVYAEDSVPLEMPIKFDRTKLWSEGLGVALSKLGVMMTTNVDKRLVVLKMMRTSRIVRFKDNLVDQ